MTYQQPASDEMLDRRELGAAGLLNDIVGILHTAVEHSGLSQSEIAERMGVGESRISQILNGEGNLRAATLGRFLGALGLKLSLDLVEFDNPPRRRKRNRQEQREDVVANTCVWEHRVITAQGSHPAYVIASNIDTPGSVLHSTGVLVLDTNDALADEPRDIDFAVSIDSASAAWAFPIAKPDSSRVKDATLAYS